MLETYGSLENVAIITLAPEKDRALEVIKELTARNITVSLGHSTANVTQGKAKVLLPNLFCANSRDFSLAIFNICILRQLGEVAVEHGSRLITHLFNAMLPVITLYS